MIKSEFYLEVPRLKSKEMGFRYDYKLNDCVYKFPVYKYKNQPVIFCKIGVDEETNHIWYNIYDANDNLYVGYYNEEYGHNAIIEVIDRAILHKLKDLGAKRAD